MQGTLFGLWWAFAIAVCRLGIGGLAVKMLGGLDWGETSGGIQSDVWEIHRGRVLLVKGVSSLDRKGEGSQS